MTGGVRLRPYQESAKRAVVDGWATGAARTIVNLPTGTGKTITGLDLAAGACRGGGRALWLAHTDELVQQPHQTARVLYGDDLGAGIVKAEQNDRDARLVIGSVQTLARSHRLQNVLDRGKFGLVVVDEAHHAAAQSYQDILAATAGGNGTPVLGLTATVERGDRKDLRPTFPGGIIYQLALLTAIQDGWLVPFRPIEHLHPELNLGSVKRSGQDYAVGELATVLEESGIHEVAADAMAEHARDRKAIVFCGSVKLAEWTAEAITARGVPAAWVSGLTPRDERRDILRRFRAGEIQAVANCNVLTEGYDEPSVAALIMARPTQSKPLYIQMLGRGLRIFPGKTDCRVIDVVGVTTAHTPYQAAMLLEQDAGSDGGGGGFELGGGDTRKKLRDLGFKPWCHWVEIRGSDGFNALAASGGQNTMVVLLGDADGGWNTHVWRNRDHQCITHDASDLELAMGLGEDVVRRTEGGTVAKDKATWRRGDPSEKQLALLLKWRTPGQWPTRGEAGDAITAHIARWRLRELFRARRATRGRKSA